MIWNFPSPTECINTLSCASYLWGGRGRNIHNTTCHPFRYAIGHHCRRESSHVFVCALSLRCSLSIFCNSSLANEIRIGQSGEGEKEKRQGGREGRGLRTNGVDFSLQVSEQGQSRSVFQMFAKEGRTRHVKNCARFLSPLPSPLDPLSFFSLSLIGLAA